MDRNWLLAGLAAVAASLLAGFYSQMDKGTHEAVSNSGFDLSSVSPSARPAAGARDAIRSSPAPLIGGVADAPAVGAGGVPLSPSAGDAGAESAPPGAAGASAGARLEGRAREAAFLARHGAALKTYHAKMAGIALKWRKTHKVVAEVDMAFAAMPRYMEVKKRFDRSRDPFAFARDALALPEVRAEISKRLKEPAVWTAALGMITETVKTSPPPKEFYEETLAFLSSEPAVSEHVSKFTEEATQQAPLIAAALPVGTDLTPLQKMVSDVGAATANAKKR